MPFCVEGVARTFWGDVKDGGSGGGDGGSGAGPSQTVHREGAEKDGVTAHGSPRLQVLCGLSVPVLSMAETETRYVQSEVRPLKQNVSTELCKRLEENMEQPGDGTSWAVILYWNGALPTVGASQDMHALTPFRVEGCA